MHNVDLRIEMQQPSGSGRTEVDDREKENHDRDVRIAENEAARKMFSKIRVSAWAIALAVVLGLMLLLHVATR